jgi:hypothetical protein
MMNLTLREVFDRYGPTLAIIVAIAALVALMPAANVVTTSAQEVTAGAGATARDGADEAAAADTDAALGDVDGPSGSGPIEASESFTSVSGAATAWGPQHGPGNYPAPGAGTQCREDGAMPAFSLYSPRCVPKFSGNNGGATATGVTKDDVLMVWYRPQEDPATSAALSAMGGYDEPAVVERAVKALMRYYNLHTETYGREVKLKIFDATGAYDDPEVARADAVTIATQLKPFAVVEVNMAALPEFTTELAARKVICLCTTSHSREFYKAHSPYLYTVLPVIDEYYEAIAEYWGKRLAGKPAKFAGRNVRVSNDVRKFGLVYIEGVGDVVDPQWKRAAQHFEAELKKYGVVLTKSVSYTYDVQQQQQQTTNIIGQMVASGVNVITCVCDGLYPVFLTSEATRQGYFPEWFISGTNLIDTTFFGRTYDPQQWSHAYGISPLWVFAARKENGSGYRAYHHVAQGDESKGIDTYQASISAVFAGVHYAGPKLTVQNWSQGIFLAPALGGRVNAPLVKFTERDPGAIKDWVEVWWDGDATGSDELNNNGRGILLKSNKGVRYTNGKWPAVGPYAFGDDPAPVFRTTEKATFDHDADGHTHKASERCRSCG